MDSFGTRLRTATARRGRLCVGIDPHPELLAAWGLDDDLAGLERFTATVAEALAERVAVVKPQSAFYERHGSRGIMILESYIRQLREAGALVLLDAKRGDIGSTVAAYARAYLDQSAPMAVDAVTASPYLGVGALRPMIDTALAQGAGVFVLALTSNPQGREVQHAVRADGRTVAQAVIDEIAQVNAGVPGPGSIGVVVGATIGRTGHDMTEVNGPILVPGLGAQGGTAAGLREVFGVRCTGLLPSYSREVLGAGPGVPALRAAADRVRSECESALVGADEPISDDLGH